MATQSKRGVISIQEAQRQLEEAQKVLELARRKEREQQLARLLEHHPDIKKLNKQLADVKEERHQARLHVGRVRGSIEVQERRLAETRVQEQELVQKDKDLTKQIEGIEAHIKSITHSLLPGEHSDTNHRSEHAVAS